MLIEVETKYLFIDSDRATIKLSNDDVFIDIGGIVMSCQDDTEYIDVVVSEFTCSRDFYAVDDTNNNFSIYYNGANHYYQITNGFPSVLTIDTELQTDLETAFPAEDFIVQYLKYEGCIEITATFTGAIPADLALNFNVPNSAYKIFGFTKNIHPFTIIGQNINLKGDALVNVLGSKKEIFVRSSLINSTLENQTTGLQIGDVLAKIPVLTAPLNTITFFNNGADIYRNTITSPSIVGFNLRLTTEDTNTPIGLNSNFLITLKFIKMKEVKDDNTLLLKELVELNRLSMIRKDENERNKKLKLNI